MDDPKTYGTRVIWRSGWVWMPFRIRRCHPIESWIGQLVETYAQLLPRYPFISPFLSFSLSAFCSLPLGAGFRDCYATSSLYSLWNHEATLPALTLEPLLGETMRRFSCSSGRERVVFPPSFRSSSGWRCINKSKDDRFLPHFRIYIYIFFSIVLFPRLDRCDTRSTGIVNFIVHSRQFRVTSFTIIEWNERLIFKCSTNNIRFPVINHPFEDYRDWGRLYG